MNQAASNIFVTVSHFNFGESGDHENVAAFERCQTIYEALPREGLIAERCEDDENSFYRRLEYEPSALETITAVKESYGISDWEFKLEYLLPEYRLDNMIALGGAIRVTDPCYDMETWCAGTIANVLPGEYACYAQRTNQGRSALIRVAHEHYLDEALEWEAVPFEVGTDSGTAGIFDLEFFCDVYLAGGDEEMKRLYDATMTIAENPDYIPFEEYLSTHGEEELCEDKDWFNDQDKRHRWIELHTAYCNDFRISRAEFESYSAAVYKGKYLVSPSGYGDGGYECRVARNADGKVVGVEIAFIELDGLDKENETE